MPRKAKGSANGEFKTERNPFKKAQESTDGALFKDCPGIGHAIDSVLGGQCAILLSRTRDGGAVCITILDDDKRHRAYCSGQVELDASIAALSEMYG